MTETMNENTPGPIVSDFDTTSQEEDWKSKYLYLLADFDNYKKNVHNRVLTLEKNSLRDIVNKFLPVIDDLERMSEHLEDEESLKVIEMTINKFTTILQGYNIKKFNSIGQIASPKLHSIISKNPSPELAENTITKVYQEGYMINNDLLRPAIVEVS